MKKIFGTQSCINMFVMPALVLACIFCITAPAFAQSPFGNRDMSAIIDLGNAYQLPGIYATNLSVETSGNVAHGSFTALNNEQDIIGGLQYNIEILDKNQTLFDVYPNYAQFSLNPGQNRQIFFDYNLPHVPAGDYIFRIQIDTNGGRLLGWNDAPLTIKSTVNSFIKLTPVSLSLPEYKSQTFEPQSGPNVSGSSKFSLKASLQNQSSDLLTFFPKIDIYNLDIAKGNAKSVTLDPVAIKANEKIVLDFPITASDKPGVYSAILRLVDSKGNAMSSLGQYQWVVRGAAADILPLRISQLAIKKDQSIIVRADIVGAPDAQTNVNAKLEVTVSDAEGVAAYAITTDLKLSDSPTQTKATLVLKRDLVGEPTINAIISDSSTNIVLAYNSAKIDSADNQTKPAISQKSQSGFSYYLAGILILFLIVVGVILLIKSKKQKYEL